MAMERMGNRFEGPIWVEVKFNWSHGHSTPRLEKVHGGKLGDTYFVPKPKNYKIVWTIRLVERAMPSSNVRKMASFTAWHIPKSSALIISRRASAGYPNNSFVRPLYAMLAFLSDLPAVSLDAKVQRNGLHS